MNKISLNRKNRAGLATVVAENVVKIENGSPGKRFKKWNKEMVSASKKFIAAEMTIENVSKDEAEKVLLDAVMRKIPTIVDRMERANQKSGGSKVYVLPKNCKVGNHFRNTKKEKEICQTKIPDTFIENNETSGSSETVTVISVKRVIRYFNEVTLSNGTVQFFLVNQHNQ